MSNLCNDDSPFSKRIGCMSREEKIEFVLKNVDGTFDAIKYIYDNCDENSEFGEMIFDAYLLFSQTRTAIHAFVLDSSSEKNPDEL